MDNGEKFSDVVRALHWAEVENLLPCPQIDASILHWSRIPATRCIHCHRIGLHLKRKWKDRVVAILRRIL